MFVGMILNAYKSVMIDVKRSRASRKKPRLFQSVNFILTALLVERSELGPMCYRLAAPPSRRSPSRGNHRVHAIDNGFLPYSF